MLKKFAVFLNMELVLKETILEEIHIPENQILFYWIILL